MSKFNNGSTIGTVKTTTPTSEYKSKPVKVTAEEKRRSSISCLRRNTIDLINSDDYLELSRVWVKNMSVHLKNDERWANELFPKSVFSTLFSKDWLNTVNISRIANFKVNSAEDVTKLINSLMSALLESGNGLATATDVKDAIKILTTLKTDNDQVINSLASSLSDSQLKAINKIVIDSNNAKEVDSFDF